MNAARRAAGESIVLPGYRDANGAYRRTHPEAARAVVEALGGTPPAAGGSRTMFVRPGERRAVPGGAELRLEDGTTFTVDRRLPPDLPLGYHELRAGGTDVPVLLVVSPGVCRAPRPGTWGFSVQLYALCSRKSWGIGDLGDLRRFGRFAHGTLGADAVLLNPLDAVAPTLPQQTSPYSPTTRLYGNTSYLRIEDVPGARALGPLLEPLARESRTRPGSGLLDRDRVFSAKMRALERIFSAFEGSARFDAFRAREGRCLSDYATFSALAERHGPNHSAWPAKYRDKTSRAVQAFAKRHAERIRFHEWTAWCLDEQLEKAGRAIDLVRDLPVGVDPGGADVWAFGDVFGASVSVGAPPDAINRAGQNWGLSPLVPFRLDSVRYEPFIRTVRAAFRHGKGLRIDHVMGLFRLYLVPEGRDPQNGAYVRFPARELLDIVALEAHRANAFVVGEDLGTVQPGDRRELGKRGILSYRLVWFENAPPRRYPSRSLAAVTTHDLPTVAGVVTGADGDDQERFGLGRDRRVEAALAKRIWTLARVSPDAPLEDVIERVYAELAKAPSVIVLAALEDAVVSPERPNLPGHGGPPSFCRPLPASLEEIERHPLVRRLARVLGTRKTTGAGAPATRLTRRSRRSRVRA